MKLLYIFIVITNILLYANDNQCSKDTRITQYNKLLTIIEDMQNDLPELTPKEKLYYKQIDKKWIKNYNKYKRILNKNEYLVYKMSSELDYVKVLLQMTLMYSKNNTKNSLVEETRNLSIVTNKIIKYNSSIYNGFSNSKLLYERNIVNKHYFKNSQDLILDIWSISDCILSKMLYDIRDYKN